MVLDGSIFKDYLVETNQLIDSSSSSKIITQDKSDDDLQGLYTVLEEIPGLVESSDMTQTLIEELDYWPSYNVPYYTNISILSGFSQACDKLGDGADICYDSCSRANIFRERESSVTSQQDLNSLLEYNDWENDPLSQGNPSGFFFIYIYMRFE